VPADDPELEKKKKQSEAAAREVEAQVVEAPLARRQEELDRVGPTVDKGAEGEVVQGGKEREEGVAREVGKRAALVDDDRELKRVDKVRESDVDLDVESEGIWGIPRDSAD
jgi:hypothetical protein